MSDLPAPPVDVVCAARASMCVCSLEGGHGGAHTCDCGGQWEGDYFDSTKPFTVIKLPPIFGRDEE